MWKTHIHPLRKIIGIAMKKKTSAMARPETPNNSSEEEIQDENPNIQHENGFYACYLLTSLCPRFKGHTYIGFTVNPRRRIRQHNGEIRSGAFRTKKRRPWEMVFCIYGFSTNVSALQFEWAWQHPTESLAVRQAAASFKSFSGVANKIRLAYTMLNLPAWKSFNITVNYFSTKYSNHSAGCPSLPEHMKVQILPMDELPCYNKTGDDELRFGDNDETNSSECDFGAAKEGLIELNSCSIDEFQSSDSREKSSSSPEACAGSKRSEEDDAYKEDSCRTSIVDEITREKFGWFEGYGNEQQRLISDCADHSPVSKVDYNSTVRGDFSNEVKLLSNADEGQALLKSCHIQNETEVIDLLSPSPDCRLESGRKKRRVSTCFPVFIDLT